MKFVNRSRWHRLVAFAILAGLLAPQFASGQDHRLDELSLERWKTLREVERHQMQVAEKYYREKDWKVAASEYDKFLTLYERSDAASYSLLMWSLAQVQLRKGNTAIKDGFQSVIDYWPDSPDAIVAAYYIGHTYKDIGQVSKSKKALLKVAKDYPKHLAGVHAMVDLVDIATVEKDDETRVEMLKKLTFDAPRGKYSNSACVSASQQLAAHQFEAGAFDEAVKALDTTYPPEQLTAQVVAYARAPIDRLVAQSETKAKGEKLADRLIAYLREQMPDDTSTEAGLQQARQNWFAIADVQVYSRRHDKVPAVYEQMAKVFGADDEMLGRFAAWQKSQDKYDEARQTYRRFQDKIEGLNQVAYSHRQQRKVELAVAAYNQLIGQDPENSIRWKTEMAAAYREVAKYAEAIGVYQELLKEDVEHADNWLWQIAIAHRDAKQFKEAIGFLRQCNNFPENYKQMAYCHRALKQYNEALILYNQIVGGHEASAPWGLLQVAYTREEAGQKEPAIKAFQQVCKRFPKDSHASVAHAHLQNKYKISVTLGGGKDE